MYKDVKQFTANMFFNTSWAIFSPVINEKELQEEEEKIVVKEETKGKKASKEVQ